MKNQDEVLLKTRKFTVIRRSYSTPRGETFEREIIHHPGAVTIIPVLEGDRVCLIRNFRAAVGQTLIELPAGTLEKNEPPEETALRELVEETGYRAERIEKLHEFNMSPGILDERMHIYVAHGLTAGTPEREPGEQIENYVVSWQEAIAMALDGRIQDAKTLVGLLAYDQVRREEGQGRA